MEDFFNDRKSAGILLAHSLKSASLENTIVIALPRGGVPVAYEIAKKFNLPLDLLIVKKITTADNPEYAIGAIEEGGHLLWNEVALKSLQIEKNELRSLAHETFKKIHKLQKTWSAYRLTEELTNKTIILVDDGLATGLTMKVAIQALRAKGVTEIVVAIPVGPQDTIREISKEVEQVVVLKSPHPFGSVGNWYKDFGQVSEDEVAQFLESSKKNYLPYKTQSPEETQFR